MWGKLGAIVGLVIGICIILFRKRYTHLIIQKQLEERTTPKTTECRQQLKEMEFEGILRKVLETVALVIGLFFILMSICEFLPQFEKYIRYFIAYFMLSFFAACVAGFLELKLIAPFFMRSIRKYTQERCNDWHHGVETSSESDRLKVVRSESMGDPILRNLRRKAFIHLVVCFAVLFIIFLFAFYTIFRITS